MTLLHAALLAFISCAFLGWWLEAFWVWLHKERVIKGWLHPLPLKPVYGAGGAFIVLAGPYITPLPIVAEWLLLSVVLGGFEALAGYAAERFYKRKLWRYPKGTFLNVGGYTDAFHASIWGLIGIGILHLL